MYVAEYGKKVPIQVKLVDTASDPVQAVQAATELIVRDQVDLMFALHTPDTVNPVSAVCEKYEMPCIALDCPIESWLADGPYSWSYLAFWTLDALTDVYIGMWDEFASQTNKVVGGLWPDDADGSAFAELFHQKLPERGYTVIDPGRFPSFKKDFGSIIQQFQHAEMDILTGILIPPDWATAWRQCRQRSFVPKIASVAKAILFLSAVNALGGNLPEGLTAEVWWSPLHPFTSSVTGETAAEVCDAWSQATGKPWTPPPGFQHAAFEIAFDALTRAETLDNNALREAIARTDLNTIVGHIRYNSRHSAETPLIGGQWTQGTTHP